MIPLSDIHILLPAFNEEKNIREVVRSLQAFGLSNILVVDDGSEDRTVEKLKDLQVLVVSHRVNRGAGAAVQTGIELARKKNWAYLALMDSDGQHFPEDLIFLKEEMEKTDCDLVIGSRFKNSENKIPTSRKFFNSIANLMTNFFCKKKYSDSQSGLRLLNRRTIRAIELEIDGFGFCSEMIVEAEKKNLSIHEIPCRVIYTDYSMSKGQNFQLGVNTALNFIWKTVFK